MLFKIGFIFITFLLVSTLFSTLSDPSEIVTYIDSAIGLITLHATHSFKIRFELVAFRIDQTRVKSIRDGFEFLIVYAVLLHHFVGLFIYCNGFVF